jgi:acyl-CoA synthetase (AMP-forming)/AMP-acid ligase II
VDELIYSRLFLPAAERHAGRAAIHDGSYSATFGEHAERALRLADALGSGLGLDRTDRFAVVALNGHRYLELYHAAFLGGAVINPVNYRLADRETAHVLRHSGARVVFVDAAFAGRVQAVVDAGETGIERVVSLDEEYEQLLASGTDVVPPEPGEDSLPMLMYTGGTTGLPKGVASTQRAQMLNLYHLAMVQGLAFSEGAVYLHHMPMFHSMGANAALSAAAFGTEATAIPAFEPGAFMSAVAKHGVTETVLVPTMIAMILQHPEYAPERLSSLKRIGYGGMAMPHSLLAKLQESSPDIELLQGYGMTEACPTLTFLTAEDHRRTEDKRHSVGRPLPGVDVAIFDGDGNRLPAGEVGEVCARGGNIMTGYWNDPDATAKVFRDGWYRTGDLGRFDEEGYLYLVDRVDDMIVTGGENVYSVEVENALTTFAGVLQVAVVGMPDDVWGQRVHGIVVLAPDAVGTTEEQLAAHARTTIAGYKVPKTWELRTDPLPVSGAGKPLKRELRP